MSISMSISMSIRVDFRNLFWDFDRQRSVDSISMLLNLVRRIIHGAIMPTDANCFFFCNDMKILAHVDTLS